MGFFSSTTKTDKTTEVTNKELDKYTKAYRDFSPWAFATLDPTATLAALGNGSKLGGVELGNDFKTHLKSLSDDEKKGATAANEALDRIRQRQETGQFLTPQETDFINQSLDKAFEYAHTTGMKDWTLGAQTLAGGRGLRTSDTPVAAPAMAELRNFELGLGSKRAELGLQTTMAFAGQQNQFDEALMEFQKGLQQNAWATRQGFMFGGGLQGASQVGYKVREQGSSTFNPSMMSNISQTMGVLKQGTELVKSWNPGGSISGGLPKGAPGGS